MLIYRKRNAEDGGFEKPEGMPEALYKLLCARGISSVEQARAFLRPDINMLNDPLLFADMRAAIDIVMNAKSVCVYGDYDVDGVCASAIMSKTLDILNIPHEVYLPSRHSEGYGLNEAAIREIAARRDVLITVDCGITSVALVKLATELGMKVIVSDHHLPAEELPDCPVLDPYACDYPAKTLCGAGVALKLSEALIGREAASEFLDLAALATVADIVPLTGESRVIAKLGLAQMNRAPRLGIRALAEVAGISDKKLTASSLGFQIGPRLNASGRLGAAKRAFELLCTDDPDIAESLSRELDAENAERRRQESEIFFAAEGMLEGFDFIKHRAIVLAGEGWNPGVIGLAASRLTEKYNFPAILISLDGDKGSGSCRSIPGISIHAALTAASSRLEKFGGHAQAAGLTIARAQIPAFIEDLDSHLSALDRRIYIPVREYDSEITFGELTERFVKLTDDFAPVGMGNPAPVFRRRARISEKRRVGKDGAHLSLRLFDGTGYVRGVSFRDGALMDLLPSEIDALFIPKLNEFNGARSVEIECRAIKPALDAPKNPPLPPFLTQLLYNHSYTQISDKRISADELRDIVITDPQGALIIAADVESAPDLGDCADIFLGVYPDDPRAFNAICVRPAGERPRGYKRIIWAGMPAPDGEIALDSPCAKWLSDMPDLGDLRRAYKAVKSRPGMTIDEWARALHHWHSFEIDTVTAAFLILSDMGLIDLAAGKIVLTDVKQVEPTDSNAYLAATALKKGGAADE